MLDWYVRPRCQPFYQAGLGSCIRAQLILGDSEHQNQHDHDSLTGQFADKRSMEERRHDHDKLVAQRHEEERLKKKGKEWKEEQKRLAAEKEEEEAAAVKNQLLQADLGPTPSRPGTVGTLAFLG